MASSSSSSLSLAEDTSVNVNLDTLLDSALDTFSAVEEEEEAPVGVSGGGLTVKKAAAQKSPSFDPLAPSSSSLKKKSHLQENAAAGTPFAPSGGPSVAPVPEGAGMDAAMIADMTENMAKLLADLAHAESETRSAGDEEAHEAHVSDDIQKTLQALREQGEALLASENAQTSENAPTSAAGEASTEALSDEIYAQLQQQFRGLDETGDVQTLVDGMLQSLLSRDVLHGPMRELKEAYPTYLEENKHTISHSDRTRYEQQYEHICALVDVYEQEGEEDFSAVVDLLQKMQACGNPPPELVSKMAPGVSFDESGSPAFPQPGAGGLEALMSGGGQEACTIM